MKHNPAYPDTDKTIAIDFDGVIHDNNKGYHDGTCYGEPVRGAINAIKMLSGMFKVVVYTTKARKDRPRVNYKTGADLVWDWLKEHGIFENVYQVTAEKPPAKYYIDDRAIKFVNWGKAIDSIMCDLFVNSEYPV